MHPRHAGSKYKRQRSKFVGAVERDDEVPEPGPLQFEADYSNGHAAPRHDPIPAFSAQRPSFATTAASQLADGGSTEGPAETILESEPADAEPRADPSQSRWTPISALMREFQDKQRDILGFLFRHEVDARVSNDCACQSGKKRIFKCHDCAVMAPCCEQCIKQRHVHAPFHRISAWTGSYFARSSLYSVEYELCLGHDGARCPNAANMDPHTLVIVHTNGVHRIYVVYCECAPRTKYPFQLLLASLYPASWTQPATAFTFQLLEHYHLDSLQSRKPAYDFWAVLRRLIDNTRADPVPDRYEELLRVSREWRVLKLLKRSGQALGISEYLPNNSNFVALLCPACPIPGLNLPENWKEQLTDANQHEFTLFLGIDGNYHAVRKNKRHDRNDVPLLDGRGYFTDSTRYRAFLSGKPADAEGEHVSTCANLKSMKAFTRRKGLIVSGIVQVFCARHSMHQPNSMVDLEVGEKFRILDYALAEALDSSRDHDLPTILTCDKGCQYGVKLVSRFAGSELLPRIEKLKVLVPKLHLQGHKENCRYMYSLNYTPHCGRTDGEGVERPWAHSNDTAKITRDQNPGHRQDTFDDCNGDWNYCKIVALASSILAKLKRCRNDLQVAIDNFDAVSQAAKPEQIVAWEMLSCDPVIENGEVKSVYRADRAKLPTYGALLEALEKSDEREAGKTARKDGTPDAASQLDTAVEKVFCATNFIAAGLDIEERQTSLTEYRDSLPEEPTWDQLLELATRRRQLRELLTSFYTLQQIHMPRLGPTQSMEDFNSGQIDEDFGRPEDDPLALPSSWPNAEQRETYRFTTLGKREYVLRRNKAMLELARMGASIFALCAFFTWKHQNVSGQRNKTRVDTKINSLKAEVDRHADVYRRHFGALSALGLEDDDMRLLQPLRDSELKNLYTHSATPESLGSTLNSPAWFWGGDRDSDDRAAEELDELTQEELRARWFRARAHRDRYLEEEQILLAELKRVPVAFERLREAWLATGDAQLGPNMSDDVEAAWGRRAYSLKQAAIYTQRIHDAKTCASQADASTLGKRSANRQMKQRDSYPYEWSFY